MEPGSGVERGVQRADCGDVRAAGRCDWRGVCTFPYYPLRVGGWRLAHSRVGWQRDDRGGTQQGGVKGVSGEGVRE